MSDLNDLFGAAFAVLCIVLWAFLRHVYAEHSRRLTTTEWRERMAANGLGIDPNKVAILTRRQRRWYNGH